jgi:phosphocarrier protein
MTEKITATVTIVNQRGLHARAAAKLVKCVSTFNAEVEIDQGGTSVLATSIMGLMMLAAKKGTTLDIRASGPAAKDVVEALTKLITDRFDEDE